MSEQDTNTEQQTSPAENQTTMAEIPSGSAQPAGGGQGSGTQAPANPAPPPPTASGNSEAGWSGGGPDPEGHPAPQTATRAPEAARTDPETVHSLRGMQVGTPVVDKEGNPVVGSGMIGGGDIVAEHLPPPPENDNPAQRIREWTRRAMQSPHFAKLGALAGRPVNEWGLFGKGTTVRGLMLGINVDTLEKELFHDGHVIEQDAVYANVRNFPEDAVAGDNLKQAAGAR